MDEMSLPLTQKIDESDLITRDEPSAPSVDIAAPENDGTDGLPEETNSEDRIDCSVKSNDVTDNLECYVCDQCGETFNALDTLKSHYKSHVGLDCQLCNKSFATHKTRWVHFMHTHLKIKKYVCDVCGKAFPWKFGLKEHYFTHTGKKPLSCEICQKTFTNKHALSRHYRCHTGEKPYTCSSCNKCYAQISALSYHVKVTHLGIKPHNCPVCNQGFTTLKHFRKHTAKNICGNKKPAVFVNCRVCNEEIDEAQLRDHSMTHTSEETNTCDVCGKCFPTKSSLGEHVLHHTRAKKFICDVCQKGFPYLSELKKHLYIHMEKKPFNCDQCDKSFTRETTLAQHHKIHEGHIFACDICNKVFTYPTSLEYHYKSHSDKKAHKCKICHKGYGEKYIKQHLLSHFKKSKASTVIKTENKEL